MITFLSFLFLTLAFLSLWIDQKCIPNEPEKSAFGRKLSRYPKNQFFRFFGYKFWILFLGLSILTGVIAGQILWLGLIFLITLIAIWMFYAQKPNWILFVIITIITTFYKLHLIPGYHSFDLTPKFHLGLQTAILGLLPLGLMVPLAKTVKDWKLVLMGLLIGCGGIGILAILATITNSTHWEFKVPSFFALRSWSNLVLTAIPEEGFYRGFVQNELCRYFKNLKLAKWISLILTSLIFTIAHIYWSPNLAILSFVFIAGILYGAVYLISGKIESAILTHFLLNIIHMIFFEYHAM